MTRVTTNIYFESMIRNIRDSFSELNRLQNQLQTQKAFERPSENPVQANQAIILESNLKQIEQSAENVDNGYDLLTFSDQVLDNVLVPLNTALEKTAQGLNAENDDVSRQAIANELQAIMDNIISIGNTQLGDKNIFGGSEYLDPVFTNLGDDVLFRGNNDSFKVNVFGNERIQSNITATQAFGASSTILDSDRNLDARLAPLNLDFLVPLDRSVVKTAAEIKVVGNVDIANAFEAAGGARANIVTELNNLTESTDFTDFQTYQTAVRDAAVAAITATSGSTFANMTSVETTQVKAAIDAASTVFTARSNTLVLKEGQNNLSSRLNITLTSTNSTTTSTTITTINDTIRSATTEVENYAKIEAVNAFYEALADKSVAADVTISDTFADNITNNIAADANRTSITFASEVQAQALAAIGTTYELLTSNQKQQVDAAVNAARNAYATSEFKALQTRSGMVITHNVGDQISIDESQTNDIITRHFQAGGSLNRSTYAMSTGLNAAIAADDDFNLNLSNGTNLNIDVYNGDTVSVIAKRINQAVNKLNVEADFRQIVASVDNGELLLTSTEFFSISGSTDISDRAAAAQSGLYANPYNVDDLRNGNGFEYGTQKIIADQLVNEKGVGSEVVYGDIVTILEGDSMEYLMQQLNDLEGFDASLNTDGTGIEFQNTHQYSTILDISTTSIAGDTLTITDDDGSTTTIDFTGITTVSASAEAINAASNSNTKLHARVNNDGTKLIVSSNESIGLSFATATGLDVLSSQMTDLSNIDIIDSDMIQSLGLDRNADDDGLTSGENILGRQTRLRELNDGGGVQDGSIQISVSNVSYQVDLSSAVTLQDVKTLIEDELGTLVTVGLNNEGNGLSILSNSNVDITISELEGGSVGRQLGLIELGKTSVTGDDIQGSDLNPRFVGETLIQDLNGGQGIDNTGFTITNGSNTGIITLDSDGDGSNDIRTLNDLVNHINTKSSQDNLYVVASLEPETGQIKIASQLSNTTLSIKERPVTWDRFITKDIPPAPGAATTLNITYDDTIVNVAVGAADTAQTIVDNINTAANTANFGFTARINSDGNVDIVSNVGISVTDSSSNYGTEIYTADASIFGATASDLGLLGSFSETSLLSSLNNGTGIENGKMVIKYGSYNTENYYVDLDNLDYAGTDVLTFYNENAGINTTITLGTAGTTDTDANLMATINADANLQSMGITASLIDSGGVQVLNGDRFTVVNTTDSLSYTTQLGNYGTLDNNATSVTVDLNFAETLSDVKLAIEAATNGNVLVSFDHSNRIALRLAANDQNQGIEFEELDSSLDVAHSLGLINENQVFGRTLRDGSTETLSESTLLSDIGLEINTSANVFSGENDLVLSLNNQDTVTYDLSSANTVGDVISLINSTKVSDLDNNINISARINKGQYISLTDENGSPLFVVQSGFSNAAEKLGLVADPDIEDENTYHSEDLNPENQTLNVFSVLTNLRNEFRKGDISESYVSTQLNLLERVRDQFLTSRGEAGSRIARFDLLKTRFEEEKIHVQDLYSQKVDIDIISVTQKFLAQQQIYQSGLSAASRVLGTSLFNFL